MQRFVARTLSQGGEGRLTTQFFAIIDNLSKGCTSSSVHPLCLISRNSILLGLPRPNCGETSRTSRAALRLIILYLRLRQSNSHSVQCKHREREGEGGKDSANGSFLYRNFHNPSAAFCYLYFLDTFSWIVIAGIVLSMGFYGQSKYIPTSCEKILGSSINYNYKTHQQRQQLI